MANIIQINGYTISSSNTGGGSSFPYTGSAIISGSLTVTGSTTSTLGFTGSLFGTSSWANNVVSASFALTSSRLNAENTSILAVSSNRMLITASNSVLIDGGAVGISLQSKVTVTGDVLPGPPITNNTSSWSLGSPTQAWKDLYVSNGSVYFISGSNTASISFTNGAIDFGDTTINIPSSSIVQTASFAQTSSFLLGSVTSASYAETASISTTSSFAQTASIATTASYSTTASFAQNVYAPSFITYSGGNQVSSTTVLTDVHSSAGWDNIAVGFYEFEMFVVYNSSGTTVGSKFSISGSTSYDYLSCDVGYSTLVTDRAAFMFRLFDAGSTSPSSLLTTGNAAILQGHINITSIGQIRLRFASEVASPSNITVTDVNGYLRRLY